MAGLAVYGPIIIEREREEGEREGGERAGGKGGEREREGEGEGRDTHTHTDIYIYEQRGSHAYGDARVNPKHTSTCN